MGTFRHQIELSNLKEESSLQLEAVVDTGAFYTTFPTHILHALRVEPIGTRRFELADGRVVDMEYGQTWIKVGDQRIITIVAFGDNEGPSLLGAYTLEGLALAVDPVGERLVPRELLLL